MWFTPNQGLHPPKSSHFFIYETKNKGIQSTSQKMCLFLVLSASYDKRKTLTLSSRDPPNPTCIFGINSM